MSFYFLFFLQFCICSVGPQKNKFSYCVYFTTIATGRKYQNEYSALLLWSLCLPISFTCACNNCFTLVLTCNKLFKGKLSMCFLERGLEGCLARRKHA
ncbi:hypothetical protein J4Q44_G00104820 [Coregonus suidteri]|uniref:Secreted protein n=1 Tax=Coregonus suidteri TaxID=861788 RepID=A0AAN8M7E1_9TELE